MPLPAVIVVSLVTIGCIVFLAHGIRTQLRRRRNLRHWEKDEPLEGSVGDWD